MLSEFLWSPAHCTFKAGPCSTPSGSSSGPRSSGLVQAFYARAFVWGLVGRHDCATDLDEAAKLVEEVKDRRPNSSPAPSWLPVIDAYLKADRGRLAIKAGPHANSPDCWT